MHLLRLCPTFNACLKVCTKRSAAPLVAGWYGAPVRDKFILFAELLELVRFEGSHAVGYDCMEKTEILLQEFHR